MRILPKTFNEALNLVCNILIQGDSRYNNSENEVFLANSILNEIINLEEKEIPKINKPNENNLLKMGYVQKHEKYVAKILLKQNGFQDSEIFFERRFRGSRPDVLGEKEEAFIPVECCSCRIDKIIDYLQESEEVWIITREFCNEEMKWFVFKKGLNWQRYSKIKKIQQEKLKRIKSPLDDIMGRK
ncbi:MAG: hypothetical protein KJ646_03540 [Nanoarchaeota archaeon]|nr:hypothetical protein [Nanoarchaeota archaeon]MBU4116664.1 hypothetical protein [Nanoarchaeota archaeon]